MICFYTAILKHYLCNSSFKYVYNFLEFYIQEAYLGMRTASKFSIFPILSFIDFMSATYFSLDFLHSAAVCSSAATTLL
jgi:hypothetical protein